MGRNEPADVIAFYFTVYAILFGAIVLAVMAPEGVSIAFSHVEAGSNAELWLIALLATLGNYFATLGFTKHRAAVVGIFTFVALPLAAIIGVIAWGEDLTVTKVVSGVLIVIAGLIGSYARTSVAPVVSSPGVRG